MRGICFRGKRVDNGEWVEGIAFPHDGDKVTMFRQHPMDGSLEGVEVIPETVGQYTGLKDKNGKKVFEGDIVKYKIIGLNASGKMEKREKRSVVQYNAPCFSPFEPDLYEDYVMPEESEVIGNIHDNPKLLEGEDNG